MSDEHYIVKLRGLSWSVTNCEIMQFLSESKIRNGVNGIHMTVNSEGRPNGEAYVELVDEYDVRMALYHDGAFIGDRYIEVTVINQEEIDWIVKRGSFLNKDGCVRLRGLPYRCSKHEIIDFFSGLEIQRKGITFLLDNDGRNSGEAFVQFVNNENAEQALYKHGECIRHRYIEIFRSSLFELRNSLKNSSRRQALKVSRKYTSRYSGRDRDRYQKHISACCVYMRGLPFESSTRDIEDFFNPIIPTSIHLRLNSFGRRTGEADVEFANKKDALNAMSKDRQFIKHRYIELYLV